MKSFKDFNGKQNANGGASGGGGNGGIGGSGGMGSMGSGGSDMGGSGMGGSGMGGGSAEDLTRRLADVFDGKSNATMLKSILTEAEKSKRAGTLSNAEIDAFYEQFSPMLNGAQRNVLKGIVEKLKNI